MTALVLVVVGILLVALSPWTIYRLSTRIFRRRRRRDDTQLFPDCRHTAPNRLFRMMPSPPRCCRVLHCLRWSRQGVPHHPVAQEPQALRRLLRAGPRGRLSHGHRGAVRRRPGIHHPWPSIRAPRWPRCSTVSRVATDVLVERFAIVDKLIGDEVMALFLPQFPTLGERTCAVMVKTAEELLRGVGYQPGEKPWLPLGVGVHFGPASVGNVGTGEVKGLHGRRRRRQRRRTAPIEGRSR